MKRPSVPGPPASVALLLAQVGQSVGRSFHICLAPLTLEPRQYLLLRTVGACRDQSQQAVGASLQIPPSRMVVLVDGLEARGLLERVPNPTDRRAHALRLTAAGRRLVERAVSVVAAHEAEVCEPLDDTERTVLLGLLDRIVEHRDLAHRDLAHRDQVHRDQVHHDHADHAGHDHAGHDHAGHDHPGHDHAPRDPAPRTGCG